MSASEKTTVKASMTPMIAEIEFVACVFRVKRQMIYTGIMNSMVIIVRTISVTTTSIRGRLYIVTPVLGLALSSLFCKNN
jgi:hypothetical protein